jgi:hypothetical protein
MRERTCLKCGWVAFGVTREYAEDEVERFNAFFDASDAETREAYGNRHSTIKAYEHCMLCRGPWTNFRDAVEGDCPIGCTLNPIIVEES